MKSIRKPENIGRNTFGQYLADSVFVVIQGVQGPMVRKLRGFHDAIEAVKPGESVVIDNDVHELLDKAVDDSPYRADQAVAHWPFLAAILDAEEAP